MTFTQALRYFVVIGVHPIYGLITLAAIVVLGGATIWLSAGELDSALGMLLVIQMFLASSGFLPRARRGHFDCLLVGDGARTGVLIAHWLVSALPGASAWLILAALAFARGGHDGLSTLAGSRLCALFIVSAIAWAAGFSLPRGAVSVIWSGLLMTLLLRHTPLVAAVATAGLLRPAAALVACPFLFLAPRPPASVAAVFAAVTLAALPLLWIWRSAASLDIPLVESI